MRSLFALKLNWEKKGKRMKAKILTSFKNKYKTKLSYHYVLMVIYTV